MKTADGVGELRARGMPLGLMPGMSYEEKEAVLAPGDCVLLHSDGIVEAHDPQRGMYGFPRLKETVGRGPAGTGMIAFVLADLERFTGPGTEQEDDITMMVLAREPADPGGANGTGNGRLIAEFEVPSAPGGERDVIERVTELAAGLGLERSRVERLGTAVGEAAMNAMEHGNEFQPDRPVQVRVRVLHGPDRLQVEVTDTGAGRAAEAEAPNLEAKLEGNQTPRGWGLFLIERMVDEANERSDDEGHTLELVIHLKGDERGSS